MKKVKQNHGQLYGLKQPWEYSAGEFYQLLDEFKSTGPCHGERYNGKKDYRLLTHLDRIEYMSFGVHKWLYNKALAGCEESLFKIEYFYKLYDEVINKAKEEGLIGN